MTVLVLGDPGFMTRHCIQSEWERMTSSSHHSGLFILSGIDRCYAFLAGPLVQVWGRRVAADGDETVQGRQRVSVVALLPRRDLCQP